MRGQLRRHLGFRFLQHGIGVRAGEVREGVVYPREHQAGFVQGHDGVLEGWLLVAVRNRVHFLQMLREGDRESRRVMLVLDLVEGRHLVRQRALGHERIVRGLLVRGGGWFFGSVHRMERENRRADERDKRGALEAEIENARTRQRF